MLQADSSLKRSDEEVALLDSYASIKSNLVSNLFVVEHTFWTLDLCELKSGARRGIIFGALQLHNILSLYFFSNFLSFFFFQSWMNPKLWKSANEVCLVSTCST